MPRKCTTLTALFTVIAACAACSQQPPEQVAEGRCWSDPAQATQAAESVAQELPGAVRRFWRGANEQATALAGNLTASIEADTLVLAFADGATLRARPLALCEGRARVGSETYATVLGAPETANAIVYEVIDERVSESAQRGGLCGAQPTSVIAASEFVDHDGEWALRVASFQGAFDIDPAQQTLAPCFAFDYVLAN